MRSAYFTHDCPGKFQGGDKGLKGRFSMSINLLLSVGRWDLSTYFPSLGSGSSVQGTRVVPKTICVAPCSAHCFIHLLKNYV